MLTYNIIAIAIRISKGIYPNVLTYLLMFVSSRTLSLMLMDEFFLIYSDRNSRSVFISSVYIEGKLLTNSDSIIVENISDSCIKYCANDINFSVEYNFY